MLEKINMGKRGSKFEEKKRCTRPVLKLTVTYK